MRFRHLIHVVGIILIALSGGLLLTTAVAWLYGGPDVWAFAGSTVGTAAIGFVAFRATRLERDLTVREGYAVVTMAWVAVGVAGAVPSGAPDWTVLVTTARERRR